MVAPPGGDDVAGAVAAEADLRQRAPEIAASLHQCAQAGHIALARPSGMVADDAGHIAHVGHAARLPAFDRGHLQARLLQHGGQPCE